MMRGRPRSPARSPFVRSPVRFPPVPAPPAAGPHRQTTFDLGDPRRRALVLPALLKSKATEAAFVADVPAPAHAALDEWIALLDAGRVAGRTERSVDAAYLHRLFGDVLGYPHTTADAAAGGWMLEDQYHVPGAGTADGAVGAFAPGRVRFESAATVYALIELKAPGTDLDRDRSRGRTPVQQLWDYLNAAGGVPWGVVSDCEIVRPPVS